MASVPVDDTAHMDESSPDEEYDPAEFAPKAPERRCIVTGKVQPKETLLRFVVGPGDVIVPDVDHRLPGRGIWLSACRDVVHTAVTKRLFAKAARRAVTVAPDLAETVAALLARRWLDTLGMARRSGQAVSGYEKARAEVDAGRAALLVLARDASPAGKDKMRGPAKNLPVIELFDGGELGAVFGRDVSVHVAVAEGKLARRLIEEAGRVAGFREGTGSAGGPNPPDDIN